MKLQASKFSREGARISCFCVYFPPFPRLSSLPSLLYQSDKAWRMKIFRVALALLADEWQTMGRNYFIARWNLRQFLWGRKLRNVRVDENENIYKKKEKKVEINTISQAAAVAASTICTAQHSTVISLVVNVEACSRDVSKAREKFPIRSHRTHLSSRSCSRALALSSFPGFYSSFLGDWIFLWSSSRLMTIVLQRLRLRNDTTWYFYANFNVP